MEALSIGAAMAEFKITKENAGKALPAAMAYIYKMLEGGDAELVVRKPSKTREQEKKYHALFREFERQLIYEGRYRDSEEWKAALIDAFEQEMIGMGSPLRQRTKTILSLDLTGRLVSVRPSSKKFSLKEGSDFIEFLYAIGTQYGVKFKAVGYD